MIKDYYIEVTEEFAFNCDRIELNGSFIWFYLNDRLVGSVRTDEATLKFKFIGEFGTRYYKIVKK